ncbi:MAG: ATP-binding protein [Aquabacterium sp.]
MPIVSFVSAVLACIACVATFGLQVSARFTAGYTVPILAPTALGLMSRGQGLEQLSGIGLLLLLALQLSTALRSERRLAEGIRLRWQAEALAREKDEALRAAMRQSAVKTQFLANISHELRTPLHGILGMAQVLGLGLSDPVQSQQARLIASSGQHLLELINDLLDMGRMEAGQFTMRPDVFDLAELVAQMDGIYTVRAQEKGLDFITRSDLPSPCWTRGDASRFRQVLHNLLGNAVKFTRRGRIEMLVRRDELDDVMACTVRDSGIGIPRDALERIFQPFQQVQQTPDGEVGAADGVGLGLAIAREIARAMGGDIVVHSEPGKGTEMVFTARLPAAEPPPDMAVIPPRQTSQPAPPEVVAAPVPPTPSTAPSEAARANAQPKAGGRRVLLAEDNDLNALVAANFLELLGVELVRVKDGAAAWQAAVHAVPRPELVLMDCQMPVMDGYEATRRIRAEELAQGLSRVPIVALTATASDAERRDCLDAGMDDHLSKPCTMESLHATVQRWCGPTAELGAEPAAAHGADGEASSSPAVQPPAQTPACPGAPCQA